MTQHPKLSFQSTTPPKFEPYTFDLDAYFPNKLFLKQERTEAYDLTEKHREELRRNGWEIFPTDSPNGDFLPYTSQLFLVIGDRNQRNKKQGPVLWMRSQDLQFARKYPVVLCWETPTTFDTKYLTAHPETMTIGSVGLIFAGRAVHRYSLQDLGQEGTALWKRIQDGQRPRQAHFTNMAADGKIIKGKEFVELIQHEQEALLSGYYDSLDAAPQLAELYWRQHVLHPNTPAISPNVPSEIPLAFRQRGAQPGYLIPTSLALEAALFSISNGVSGGTGWSEQKGQPCYTIQRPGGEATVTLHQRSAGELTEDVTKQLWTQVRAYTDQCGDVLLAFLAQAITAGADERGATWIRSADILDQRGITQKKHTTVDGDKRDAGHRPEDLREVERCVNLIRNMHVTTRITRMPLKPGGRARKVKQESYLILISDFLVDAEADKSGKTPPTIAWYYQIGNALGPLPLHARSKAAWLLQSALRYNPLKQRWEKRLARYFLFHLRVANTFGGGTLRRSIRALLHECSLDEEIDPENPERAKTHFERAMTTLVADGHITDWSETMYREAMRHRPTRHWLPLWLDYELEISAASLLDELAADTLDRLTSSSLRGEKPMT